MQPVSFIVPVYNEVDNIEKLHKEILTIARTFGVDFEIIMVDDGSTDGTYKLLKSLRPVTVIRMRTNFGQTSALDAGIKAAQYPYLITMDGDLQNDPADIPAMIRLLEEDELDVVSGWRKNRKDSISKKFVSRVANMLRSLLVEDGIHDSGCTLKVYRKECFENISLYGEMHRFIPALLKMRGFHIGEMAVNHRPRVAGQSKYNMKRTMKGFADMIIIWYWNRYAVRPFHFLGTAGFLIIVFSFFSALMSLKEFFRGQDMSETFWPMFTLLTFLIGIQFLILGFISDMLMKTYYGQTGQTAYTVRDVVTNV
ncbi:MAG TPA: glycosyltransferase family 2 protein [Saprospiraceae bacterium]|nr:glycosyltransferase family 2 protein [Saprospiraceae bacterium]